MTLFVFDFGFFIVFVCAYLWCRLIVCYLTNFREKHDFCCFDPNKSLKCHHYQKLPLLKKTMHIAHHLQMADCSLYSFCHQTQIVSGLTPIIIIINYHHYYRSPFLEIVYHRHDNFDIPTLIYEKFIDTLSTLYCLLPPTQVLISSQVNRRCIPGVL